MKKNDLQLNHYNTNFKQRTFPITLVCENVSNAPNLGSIFRTSDAFGIEKIIFCGDNIPIGRKMTKTSRATDKVVNYKIEEDALTVVEELKTNGYYIVSLEITSDSLPISTVSFSNERPIALVIGDENFGVSEAVLEVSDTIIHINMFGRNSSMNVVQATTIALYEMTKQFM